MTKSELEQFVKNYIQAWSTTDAGKRKQLMEKVYSASATFYANEPGDDTVMHHGMDRIYENITKVNQRLTIENGLVTECTHYCENHNSLRVSWHMKTHDTTVVITGMNFLQLNDSMKIEGDYIFINQNSK